MLRPPRTRAVAAVVVAATILPQRVGAQVFASERAVTSQTVNGTTITVDYYRPEARGRELFGKLVKWGQPWTPGANWSTTLEVDHDVRLEGQLLPRGKYSVWALPQPGEWTLIFSRKARVFHTLPPGAEDEQLRVTAKPAQGPHVEVMTWSFPVVARGPELHLQWGTLDLPLHVAVNPTGTVAAMTPQERAAYVGVYRMSHFAPRGDNSPSTFTVFDSAGVLRLRRQRAPDTFYDAQFDLLRTGEHTFQPIMYRNGTLVGVEPAVTITFAVEGDHATGVELRVPNGRVSARGVLERP